MVLTSSTLVKSNSDSLNNIVRPKETEEGTALKALQILKGQDRRCWSEIIQMYFSLNRVNV